MDKKLKKKLLLARNRRNQLIFQHAEQHEREREKQREEEDARLEALQDAQGETPGSLVWSAKTQKIRNRLSGKKRMARDRWNRFAGTSGAGAMGR